MFQIDSEFFASCGLEALPPDDTRSLASAIHQELETRVGQRLTNGLTNHQVEEFGLLSSGKIEPLLSWVEKNAPDLLILHGGSPANSVASGSSGEPGHARSDDSDASLLEKAAVGRWLELNVPHYKNVVMDVLASIRAELVLAAPMLLENSTAKTITT